MTETTRLSLLRLCSVLLGVLGMATTTHAAIETNPPPRLNFVFFIADDVSQEDLGCYGHPTIKTPHIDALAANGMRFDNAYLTISSCSPSRCSIITGRYPHNTGAPELHTKLPESQVRFPELLREAGYYTVLSGKNHMFGNKDRAFDRITGGGGPLLGVGTADPGLQPGRTGATLGRNTVVRSQNKNHHQPCGHPGAA